jgi:phage-related protein
MATISEVLDDIDTLSIADQKSLMKQFVTQFLDDSSTAAADLKNMFENFFDGIKSASYDWLGEKKIKLGEYMHAGIDKITTNVNEVIEAIEVSASRVGKFGFMDKIKEVIDDFDAGEDIDRSIDRIVGLLRNGLDLFLLLAGQSASRRSL